MFMHRSRPGECCCCLSEEARLQRKINQRIEHQLRREKRDARRNIKLLLLGTGESGKSTFIRQMRIIHEHGFESAAERLEYVGKIQQNIVTTIYTIDHAMKLMSIDYECHTLGQQLLEKILKPCTNYEYVYCWQQRFESGRSRCFEQDNLNSCLNHIQCLQLYQSIVQIIKNLSNSHLWLLLQFWDDSGVKSCLRRRNEFNLMDSASYYMSRLEDILADSYVPSIQDILRVRIPTNGINEYTFNLDSTNFLFVDVGGQRTERRKWIHCFENVTSIIFIVALSEFDQNLSESILTPYLSWRAPTITTSTPILVNRLEESKALFKTIVTSEWFCNSSVILFLNKYDLFEEKILYGSNLLGNFFPAYTGPARDPPLAAEFILKMFYQMEPNLFRKRVIYSHFTCATETKNIKLVFQAVKETILEQMLCKEIQIF